MVKYEEKIVQNNRQQVLVEGKTKKFRFTFNKRFVQDDCSQSYQFGFCFLEKFQELQFH